MGNQCRDLSDDRDIGAFWERQFCKLCVEYGFIITPLQLGRTKSAQAYYKKDKEDKEWETMTLPDITIWTKETEHHEIKHKNPSKSGEIGLEVYRFEALLKLCEETGHNVFYTIHNHDLSGGKDATNNKIEHWSTASIRTLNKKEKRLTDKFPSWIGGKMVNNVPIYFWKYDDVFKPLINWFMAKRDY